MREGLKKIRQVRKKRIPRKLIESRKEISLGKGKVLRSLKDLR